MFVATHTGEPVGPTDLDRCATTRSPLGSEHRELRRRLAATIPRGRDAADDDPTPSVDPRVWSDHLRFADDHDPEALERLVAEYEAYARSLAGRLDRRRESREDLDQIALEALVVALRRFEPDRGLPFPAFATPTILGALRRHTRDHGWLIKVPRSIHEFASAERAATERLTALLGRTPTSAELADELHLSVDALLERQDAVHAREARSLDAPTGESLPFGDQVGAPDRALELAEDRVALAAAMAELDPRDHELLDLYYLQGWTQTRIAERLGVSQMQVSRLLNSVLRRLRAAAA